MVKSSMAWIWRRDLEGLGLPGVTKNDWFKQQNNKNEWFNWLKLKYTMNYCYKTWLIQPAKLNYCYMKLGRTSGFMAVLTLLLGDIRWYHHIAINQVLTFCWNFHGDSTWFNKAKNNWLQIGDTCVYIYINNDIYICICICIYVYVYMHICIYNQRTLGTKPARKGVFHGIWGKSESHSSAWDWWAAFLISPFLNISCESVNISLSHLIIWLKTVSYGTSL